MRLTKVLTPAAPNESMSLTFEAVALQFSNPTLSDIVYRQGGTDFPTPNSADFVIPAQTIMRIPAIGREFAFSLINTPEALKGDIQIARVTALSASEASIQLGSVQAIAKPDPYEVSRHPTLGSFSSGITPAFSGLPLGTTLSDTTEAQQLGSTYTVPTNRIGLLASINFTLIRTAAATVRSGLPRVTLIYNSAPIDGVVAAELAMQLPHTSNVVGDMQFVNLYPTNMFMQGGDSLNTFWANADTGGSFMLYGTFVVFEFDV